MASPAPIANDHVPLAFLLGPRAKHYVRTSDASESATSTPCSMQIARGAALSSSSRSKEAVRAGELFAPETHPRAREEEARRVLRQAFEAQTESSGAAAITGSPMELLRLSKEHVLHHILEMQSLDMGLPGDAVNEDMSELRHQRLGSKMCHECNQDGSARMTSFHGYARTDSVSAFLDVSGHAARIPVLSTLEAKQRHRRTLKQRSDVRASRAHDMHALLQEQQQHTKRMLQTTSLAPPTTSGGAAALKSVAHVDLGETTDLRLSLSSPVASSELAHYPSLDTARAQLEQEQRLLHERVQAKRQLELLTRQQTLAFHQERKRTLGRAKNVKRPSFLATLQLDHTATASTDSSAIGKTLAPGDALALDENSRAEPAMLQVHLRHGGGAHRQKNQDNESTRASCELDELLRRQQRNAFLQSHDNSRLHFGGGFQSKHRRNDRVASTDRRDATLSKSAKEDESSERQAYEQLSGVTAQAVAIASTKKQDFETSRRRRETSTAGRKQAS